jgi:uncharacterized protein
MVQLKTVFDSNVYVAAALRPGQYADRWLDIAVLPSSGVQLFVSQQILAEVHHKLVERFGFEATMVDKFTSRIKVSATLVSPKTSLHAVKADPDDNMILECAVTARAQLIVTADAHLLKLNPYRGIGIAHPKELKNIFSADYKRLQ